MSARATVVPIDGQRGADGGHSQSPETARSTYQDFIKHHFHALRVGQQSLGEVTLSDPVLNNPDTAISQHERNHLTALNDWMEEKGLNRKSLVGPEFGVDFKAELEKHNTYLQTKKRTRKGKLVKGLSASTIRNRNSLLEQWKSSWDSLTEALALPGNLRDALTFLAKRHGTTVKGLARGAGVLYDSVRLWAVGSRHPTINALPALGKLEKYCGLDAGALTSLVTGPRGRPGRADSQRSNYSERQRTTVFQRYRLKQFPLRLQGEWDELYALMTPVLEPDGPLRRNKSWHVDEETGECAAAERFAGTLRAFFGYLCLPEEGKVFPVTKKVDGELKVIRCDLLKGQGFSEDDLTLALVGKVHLVKSFIEFLCARAGGYNGETTFILQSCRQLLRRGTGFVRQHPDYGQRLSPAVPPEKWNAWCDAALQRYVDLEDELDENNLIEETRAPEEPIQHILDLQHPMDVLLELADLIEADAPSPGAKVESARHYRDLLLVKMITANPLRSKHFSRMTYRADGTGNLYKAEDGLWHLRYPTDFFKNRKHLKKVRKKKSKKIKFYDAELPPSISDYIETYLVQHRPHLIGADACAYVFRPARITSLKKDPSDVGAPMSPSVLSTILRKRSRRYLAGAGFGSHAYRHIIATEYIKNQHDGFEIAAKTLNDDPRTVRDRYVHLEHADYFKVWVNYHEDRLERFGKTDSGEGHRK
jgi:hypothetical protein